MQFYVVSPKLIFGFIFQKKKKSFEELADLGGYIKII